MEKKRARTFKKKIKKVKPKGKTKKEIIQSQINVPDIAPRVIEKSEDAEIIIPPKPWLLGGAGNG